VKVHSLRRGAAEAIEAIAHGEAGQSKVVGKTIEELDLPTGASIAAIVRDEQVIMAHHDTMIEADDHVILFLSDRRKIEVLEKLFQVGVSFV
jgi:trk system potassium uptake protein TrkA